MAGNRILADWKGKDERGTMRSGLNVTYFTFVAGPGVACIINPNIRKLVLGELYRRPMQPFKPIHQQPFLSGHPRTSSKSRTHLARFISNPTTVILSGHLPVISLNLAKENKTFSYESNANSSVVARQKSGVGGRRP